MSYSELITRAHLDDLAQGVAAEVTQAVRDVVVSAGGNVGRAFQAAGEALEQASTSRGRAIGEVFNAADQAIEHGSTAYIQGLSPETIGRILTDVAVAALTTAGLSENMPSARASGLFK